MPDTPAPRPPDSRPQTIGPYTILDELGRGGMGVVYRARDSRLHRDVALKVLADRETADPARLERFMREARAASALSHPHILAVFDGSLDGPLPYIVTELIEGGTLRQLLAFGSLPVKRLLDLAVQIADGLRAAHRAQLVHRDLKPENLMLTRDGRVKIVDFGLARPATLADSLTNTITSPHVIVGTVPYMSPEQARGEAVDFRSDLFSFGAVLYEMATGHQPFQRGNTVDTLTAIMRDDPRPMRDLNARVPVALSRIVARCLMKLPDERYAATADLLHDLQTVRSDSEAIVPAADRPLSRFFSFSSLTRRRRLLAVAFASIVAAVLGLGWWRRDTFVRSSQTSDAGSIEFTIEPPPGEELGTSAPEDPLPVVSPDGSRLLFRTGGRENTKWWLRSVKSATPIAVPVAGNAPVVNWAPDGDRIVWCDRKNQLWTARVGADGGSQIAAGCAPGRGASWSRDDHVLFSDHKEGLTVVSANGGQTTPVSTPDGQRRESWHRFPAFLPDSKHYVFVVNGPERNNVGIYLGQLGSSIRHRLVPERSRPDVVVRPDGGIELLFVQHGHLVIRSLDVGAGRLIGEPLTFPARISLGLTAFHGAYSASTNLLAYRDGGNQRDDSARIEWFDREGASLGTLQLPSANAGLMTTLSLSSDQQQLLFGRFSTDTNTIGIWRYDLKAQLADPVLHDDFVSYDSPEWNPDGERFIYAENSTGNWAIRERTLTGRDRALLPATIPFQYARDGKSFLSLSVAGDGLFYRVKMPSMEKQPLSRPNGAHVALSPDERWLAVSNPDATQSGIYIEHLPDGRRYPVSQAGMDPRWREDGLELFYLTLDGSMMRVPFTPGPQPGIGRPVLMFRLPIPTGAVLEPNVFRRSRYAPASSGRRFLVIVPTGEPKGVVVKTNWRRSVQ